MSDDLLERARGEFLLLERHGRVVTVTYDRGDSLNALSVQGMEELKHAALVLRDDTESTAIILRGKTVFSAGADLKEGARQQRAEMTLLEQRNAMRLGPDLCQAWAELEQITIAAIEGFCIGGALALAAACDHRTAGRTAHFRLPEVALGMNMSWRAVPRLVSLIGPSRAKILTILGKKVEADTALGWGLIDICAEPGAALDAALDLASDYAALPPVAVRMTKQAIDACAQPLGYTASFMDRDQFLLSATSNDQAEAIAAFLEKRPAKFTGD